VSGATEVAHHVERSHHKRSASQRENDREPDEQQVREAFDEVHAMPLAAM
jgi:hypothetical protein